LKEHDVATRMLILAKAVQIYL